MKCIVNLRMTRDQYHNLVHFFSEHPDAQVISFDLETNVKSIDFDSVYHSLLSGTEIESTLMRLK